MSLQKDALVMLEHEYSLLRLLHHRNKNQHRVATWWKHLNTLKRDLTKLVVLLKAGKTRKGINDRMRTDVLKLGHHIRTVVVSKCHRAFHGIVALGQFVTLGLTLLGMLAKLDSCVAKIEGLEVFMLDKRRSNNAESTKVSDVNEVVSGIADDLGEEIGEEVGDVPQRVEDGGKKRKSMGEPQESKKKKRKDKSSSEKNNREKKEKKKKKKSAIDDIFG